MSLQFKLATTLSTEKTWPEKELWRLFGIMAEFVEGTERLDPICPAVSIFGSARTPPCHPHFLLAEKTARQLSDAGFSVILVANQESWRQRTKVLILANRLVWDLTFSCLTNKTVILTKMLAKITAISLHENICS